MADDRLARHINYTKTGIPIFVEMDADYCKATPIDEPRSRVINYTTGGIPIVATDITCCDAVSDNPKVETSCWTPPSGDNGIYDVIAGRFTNFSNCMSIGGRTVQLSYAGGAWTGSVILRGGTLNISLTCDPLLPYDDLAKFQVTFSGCFGPVTMDAYAGCLDPLRIDLTVGQFNPPTCCDCFNTSATPEASVSFETNCPKDIIARHINYTTGGIPIFAYPGCDRTTGEVLGCAPTCGLTMIITAVSSECLCMEGTWDLEFTPTPGWSALLFFPCAGAGGPTADISCEANLLDDGSYAGTVTFRFNVSCGADNLGSATVVVEVPDLEYLDFNFDVDLTFTGGLPTDCGTCSFHWDSMAVSWLEDANNCTVEAGCDTACVKPSSPGTFDGETAITNCNGTPTPVYCCVGRINVRVMR